MVAWVMEGQATASATAGAGDIFSAGRLKLEAQRELELAAG
jgi:hypothetical protein